MADVVVVGDGPAGLQAALMLSKNGMETVLVGENETYLHDAYLYNYLGIEGIHGSDFHETGIEQVESFGTEVVEARVEEVEVLEDGFRVVYGGGEGETRYIVLAEGDSREVAGSLDLDFEDDHVRADRSGRTSMDNVYATGWSARDNRIQAAISVGDGAAAALDILSEEKGRQFHDFDVPEED